MSNNYLKFLHLVNIIGYIYQAKRVYKVCKKTVRDRKACSYFYIRHTKML